LAACCGVAPWPRERDRAGEARHGLGARELGGLTGQELAKELHQDPAVLSRGLGKLAEELARKPELRGVVETLYDSLRKGRRPKRSIRFA